MVHDHVRDPRRTLAPHHGRPRVDGAGVGDHLASQRALRQIAFNSCRNRHCPKCQAAARAKWFAAQQAVLLPVEYFHVVFTLPHALNALVRVNPRRLYALLFRAAAATLQCFARHPRHLGAALGITAVLHTWGQNLSQHVHVHCVVTGPDALSFLGWRFALSDENWVGLGGLQHDADYFQRVFIDTWVDLRSA
jgi:hypothetical protein